MTSPFLAGQELRASDLTAAVIRVAYASSSTTKNANTTLGDATGLAMALDANTVYGWDCYLAYDSGRTPDLKIAWTAPAGATGHWGAYGLSTTESGSGIGSLTALRKDAYGDANTIVLGGNDTPGIPGPMVARPMGYIEVGATAGNLQLRFAQQSSNATNTVIRAGCWLRAWKLA